MPRRYRSRSSIIGYEFTATSGFDYNYDPVDGRASSQSPLKIQGFDPYTDDYPASDDLVSSSQVTEPPVPARPRSLTPTRTSPSPSYILQSTIPSIQLPTPSSSRKLLILDLNGTLVFRSPHRPRRPHKSHHQHHAAFDPTALRPLRTIHPRPYMSSFTSYLFHPLTRTWLDTMIWSSAQPHSVADMVSRCFGDRKDELVAVWARDTLGLEEKDYRAHFLPYINRIYAHFTSPADRKTQTTKDLAKPWAALPLRSSGDPSDSGAGTPTTEPRPVSSPFVNEAQPQPQAHSAHTTLLLDDSLLKAHLQPWNHLCIREYDAGRRSADLALQEHERKLAKQRLHEDSVTGVGEAERTSLSSSEETVVSGNEHPDDGDMAKSKKRKRPKKEKSKPNQLPAEAELVPKVSSPYCAFPHFF